MVNVITFDPKIGNPFSQADPSICKSFSRETFLAFTFLLGDTFRRKTLLSQENASNVKSKIEV